MYHLATLGRLVEAGAIIGTTNEERRLVFRHGESRAVSGEAFTPEERNTPEAPIPE